MKFKVLTLITGILLATYAASAKELCADDVAYANLQRQACLLTWTLQCKAHDKQILDLLHEEQDKRGHQNLSTTDVATAASSAAQACDGVRDQELAKAAGKCALTAGVLGLAFSRKLISRLVSGALNAYFLSDLMAEGLKHDEQCFNDVQGKFAVVQFFNRQVEELQRQTDKENFDHLKINMFGNTPEDPALKNVNCTELRRIVTAKEKKLNETLGRMVGKKQLSDKQLADVYSAGLNKKTNIPFDCLGEALKWQVRCDIAVMAVFGAKAVVGPIARKMVANANSVEEGMRANAKVLDAGLTEGRFNLTKTPGYDPNGVYLGVANLKGEGANHYYVVAGGKRYDGIPLFEKSRTKNTGSTISAAKGIVFKLNVPEGTAHKVMEAIEKNATSRNFTCVHGACNVLKDADIVIDGAGTGPSLRLVPVLKGLVNSNVRSSGKHTPVEVLASSQEELEHFLNSFRRTSMEATTTAGVVFLAIPASGVGGVYTLYKIEEERKEELKKMKNSYREPSAR